jgi:fatty acid desaturase
MISTSEHVDMKDYSLIGPNAKRAADRGLVAAQWYHPEVPRKRMKALMRRQDRRPLLDTAVWLSLLVLLGTAGAYFWGSWICVPFFFLYGILYGTGSDSRTHESGHGTAFKTPWLNDALYQVAAFMMMQEPTMNRWSHARHHTDTIIVGRDREIIAMRPPDVLRIALNVFAIRDAIDMIRGISRHSLGRLTPEEADFIPLSARPRVYVEARAWVFIYLVIIAVSVAIGSILPLMFVGLPSLYGRWLGYLFVLTQHGGLQEDVLDHRLNSRTIIMNPVFRFIYWNMNYHVEHHMFPMVPYHALPALHEELKHDLPAPTPSTWAAFSEVFPALLRQTRDPSYYLERQLPPSANVFRSELHSAVFNGRGESVATRG